VTIIPRGRSLGVTAQLPEREHNHHTLDDLLTRLAVWMGGRAAEQLALGQTTTGAEKDLQQATRLAQRIVARWGMTESIGPVSYRVGETQPYLGGEIGVERDYSERTAALIDREVKRILREARQRATDLLSDEREKLDCLVDALLREETLDAAQIAEVLQC